MSDADLQMYILKGLGAEFDSFVVAVQTSSARSIADLTSLLYSHEARLISHTQPGFNSLPSAQNPVAMYNTKSGSKHGKGGFRPKGPFQHNPRSTGAHNTQQFSGPTSGPSGGPRPSRPNPDKDITCQICYKRGHQACNCWYR